MEDTNNRHLKLSEMGIGSVKYQEEKNSSSHRREMASAGPGKGGDIRHGYPGGAGGVGKLVPRTEHEKSATGRFGGQRFQAAGTSNANTLRWVRAGLLEQHQ